MPYIGKQPTPVPISTSDLDDDIVSLAKMAGLARGKLIYGDASGDPAALAVGGAAEVLTHDGTDLTWAAAAGGGGITAASQWRLTADATGAQDPIDANWEAVDTGNQGVLGSSMTESSGVFTFPETGIWYIDFTAYFSVSSQACSWAQTKIKTTVDSPTNTWVGIGETTVTLGDSSSSYVTRESPFSNYLFDVTNTTTHKCSFTADVAHATALVNGSTVGNVTWVTFIRLGDT